MTAVAFFGAFLVLLLVGVPIAAALGVASLAFLWTHPLGVQVMAANVYSNIAKFPLLAIPFFILAGYVLDRVGVSRRLVDLLSLLVGPVPGGLALVAIGGCVLFGAISGTGPADTAAIGTIMIPAMIRRGYDPAFAAAVVAAAATTDVLIPPSVAFVVYGVITDTSVPRLFAAGVVPGLLMGLALLAPAYLISRQKGWGGARWGNVQEILRALWDAKWGLLAPVVILGGIYSGMFTPTEAAMVGVAYGLFLGLVVLRNVTLHDLFETFREAAVASAVVMSVVAFAGLYSWTGATLGVLDQAARAVTRFTDSAVVLLLLLNVLFLLAGMVLDAISIFYVFVPILLPVMAKFGWDPVWFGVVMAVNLSIGTLTPPVALNLYVASHIARVSVGRIARAALPFVACLVAVLLVLTYWPGLVLWFPNAVGVR
ncbi:MAG: C4-dicarboxylate ABC transporter permease [candidate division GAL15 bacterium]